MASRITLLVEASEWAGTASIYYSDPCASRLTARPRVLKCPDSFRGFALPYDDSAGFTAPPAFGPFRVLHQIGSGALGPVFRSFEPVRERLVAVKAVKLDIVPEVAARLAEAFRRLAASSVDSPHVVPLVGAGLEGVTPFLASEYVSAETLDVVLRRDAPAPLETARPLLKQVAAALDAAHQAGLAHGALHPRDIFIDASAGIVRVGGIGVAAAVESVGIRTGVRRPYAAPERLAGGPWDGRADVFSLAVMTHEWLTGRRPSGLNEQDGALPAGTTPQQRVAIRRALAGALAESADARFASALAFVDALETGESPVPLLTEPPVVAEPLTQSDAPTVHTAVAPTAPLLPPADDAEASIEAEAWQPAAVSMRHADPVLLRPAAPPPTAVAHDRPRTAWALLVVGLIAGTGLGLWWRGPAPGRNSGSEAAITEGTDVTVVDAPVPVPSPAPSDVPASAEATTAAVVETRGRLLVRSVPEGAQVMLAGRIRGTTPAVIRDLPFGTHTLSLFREGFEPRSHRVSVSRRVPAREVTITLQPSVPPGSAGRPAALEVTTRPAGAQVWVDGRLAGVTPLRIEELSSGSHTIRLAMAGFRTVTTTVVVRPGQAVPPIRVSLETM